MNIPDIPDIINFLKDFNVKVLNEGDDMIGTFFDHIKNDSAFYIVNLKKIIDQYNSWIELLPRIRPYYAVKCNPNPAIIKLLKYLDCGFDCASKDEISLVMEQGVEPQDIIFANPCKASDQIKYARSENIDLLTFDDIHELYKIKLYHPDAKLIIRIKTDDSKSECKFSCKFGVNICDVEEILTIAKINELNVIGVSFHVGSNCKDAKTFYNSLKDTHDVFEIAKKVGYEFNIVDIGGGFPGLSNVNDISFQEIAIEVRKGIEDFFPSDDIKIISEPGRYFVCASHTLVTNIIGKKYIYTDGQKKNKELNYTLNEGVYGSFNCIIFDHAIPKIIPYNVRNNKLYKCRIFGPTCDSMDMISSVCELPDMAIGEWVYIENFGAYTIAAATTFNGFQQTKCFYCL